MALTTAEVARIKYELGYNLLNVGAEPYIGVAIIFEQVIQPFLQSGASTTSSTAVTAGDSPSIVTITLADATGFNVGDAVVVDVDGFQERATVRALAGSSISLYLRKPHAGEYPVTVEGGESIVRSILQRLQAISGLGLENGEGGAMGGAIGSSGIKKVDEIEFFGPSGSGSSGSSATQMAELIRQREYWRNELASVLGIVRLNGGASSGGGSFAMY